MDDRDFIPVITDCEYCGNPVSWVVRNRISEEEMSVCDRHKHSPFS